MGASDLILVWRLRRADPQACADLIHRYHGRVYAYLRHLGADPTQAEDLTQETYARVWQRIDTLRQATSLRSWLLTIARNEFLQIVRRRQPEVMSPEDLPEEIDPSPTALEELQDEEQDRALRVALRRIEPELREIVALHYFQDLSLREIGTVLAQPVGTIKSRLHRALTNLRAILEEEEMNHVRSRSRTAPARTT